MTISLLDPEKEAEIRQVIEGEEDIDKAIIKALKIHESPLRFNEIKGLLREGKNDSQQVTRSLDRLVKQKILQEVLVITDEGVVKAYAPRTDTDILVGIPVKYLEAEGYKVFIGFADEGLKAQDLMIENTPEGYCFSACKGHERGYELARVKSDWILIHITKPEGHARICESGRDNAEGQEGAIG